MVFDYDQDLNIDLSLYKMSSAFNIQYAGCPIDFRYCLIAAFLYTCIKR